VTAVWITIAALTAGTAGMKIAGPLLLGERPPGARTLAMTGLVAPALLAALVVYETLNAPGGGVTLDARTAGLAAAVVAILLRAPMIVVILVAAAVTAGLRAFS
jgi:hypothetical protein